MVLYSLTSSRKREIRQFHVVVVQQRPKKNDVLKSVAHEQSFVLLIQTLLEGIPYKGQS